MAMNFVWFMWVKRFIICKVMFISEFLSCMCVCDLCVEYVCYFM